MEDEPSNTTVPPTHACASDVVKNAVGIGLPFDVSTSKTAVNPLLALLMFAQPDGVVFTQL